MNAFFSRKRRGKQDVGVSGPAAATGGVIPDQRVRFEGKRQHAVETGGDLLRAIGDELARGQRGQLQTHWQRLEALFDIVELADAGLRLLGDKRQSAEVSEPTVPVYFVSSWFLAECHAYLLSDPDEREVLHCVTGIGVSAYHLTLERMLKVGLSEQSAIHAVANQQDLKRLLVECSERWGHALHGLFHRHPGTGAGATCPSRTDLATHERYERGYPLVGAIFVQDGFVRFFRHQPFEIRLYGKGVEQRDPHLFKIRDVPREAPESEGYG